MVDSPISTETAVAGGNGRGHILKVYTTFVPGFKVFVISTLVWGLGYPYMIPTTCFQNQTKTWLRNLFLTCFGQCLIEPSLRMCTYRNRATSKKRHL